MSLYKPLRLADIEQVPDDIAPEDDTDALPDFLAGDDEPDQSEDDTAHLIAAE